MAVTFLQKPYVPNSRHYVTELLPKSTYAMSVYDYDPGLESQFAFKTTFDEDVNGSLHLGNTLWVPREAVPYAKDTQDFRVSYSSYAINCKFDPRPEQAELCARSLKLLQEGRSHIFEAPTGWGKTVAGSYIGCRFGQPTLIVVTKEDLMEQWRKALIDVLQVPSNFVGKIQQDECEWKDKRFVLGMVHSLIIPERYPPEMYQAFGLMILDEVHQMAADCFIRICQTIPAKFRLGLSATPKRKDGKTKLLYWHIGPTMVVGTIVAMKPKVLVRQTGWRIPRKRKLVGNSWQYEPIPHGPGRMMLVTKAMASSDLRNMEAVNFTIQSYKADRVTLVLSDLRESHLGRLFQMLTSEGIPGNDIGYYVGGMKKHEIEATKHRRVVLGTYKMCATGTDCPAWDTLVMATPRAEIKQPVGRVLRYANGKKQPVILDLVDFDPIFQGFHLSRVKQYYGLGAEIVKVK